MLQQQHAATEDALQAKRAELVAMSQQVNIMKGQAEAARMQISDMSRHDADVMEQCSPPPSPLPPACFPTLGLNFCFRYTALLVNFDRNVQMYQEMYAQHHRLRDTMLASPHQRASTSSPSAPVSRNSNAGLDWNISSPNYRDLGVVRALRSCACGVA